MYHTDCKMLRGDNVYVDEVGKEAYKNSVYFLLNISANLKVL